MGKCKTKAIQTGLGTFRHNQKCPAITQAYSGIINQILIRYQPIRNMIWNCGTVCRIGGL